MTIKKFILIVVISCLATLILYIISLDTLLSLYIVIHICITSILWHAIKSIRFNLAQPIKIERYKNQSNKVKYVKNRMLK